MPRGRTVTRSTSALALTAGSLVGLIFVAAPAEAATIDLPY
jgi:hypothetical protein